MKIDNQYPSFLLRSTQGVALSSIIILVPFLAYNIYLQRPFIILILLAGIITCIINLYYCRKGTYNKNVNLYAVFPIITAGIIAAIIKLGPTGSYWSFLGMLAFYFILPEKEGRYTNFVFLSLVLPVAYYYLPIPFSVRFSVVLAGTSLYAYFAMREIHTQHRQILAAATRDKLTGLYNRSTLLEALEQAISLHDRAQIPMSLIMFDIDYFKKINDKHGHDIGDEVLQKIGDLLKSNFRENDRPYRIGGEEFLILLYGASPQGSKKIAEKLRIQVQQLSIKKLALPVTISLGVSVLNKEMSSEEWLKRADTVMYKAKISGRNQIKVWP